ncbi:unnamed protein product [Prunus brigantina]
MGVMLGSPQDSSRYVRGLMNHTKKHSHGYNPIIRRRCGSKKGVERSLGVVLVEPEYVRIEICGTKTSMLKMSLRVVRGLWDKAKGRSCFRYLRQGGLVYLQGLF